MKKGAEDFTLEFTITLSNMEQADEYYEMALNSDDFAYCKKMLKKAIKLNPKFIDAHAELASYIEDDTNRMKEYRKIEAMALEQLKNENITKETDLGHFYGMIETRPYLRLKHRIMIDYKKRFCYSLAIKEGEEIIELNDNDNLGVRFTLMGMYTALEQKEKAEQLYKKYPENSIPIHLYLAVLYYKLHDLKKSITHLKTIKKLVPTVNKIFSDSLENELIDSKPGYYRPYSCEEILLYMNEQEDIFCDQFIDLMEKHWR